MRSCEQDTSQEEQEIPSATQTSAKELGEAEPGGVDGDTGWLLEGLAGSRFPTTGCPKAPVSPVGLGRGVRRGGSRALTFQEAVPHPLVLPPGVSLGHLLEGLDPFGTEGLKTEKQTPEVSEKRLSAPGEGNHTRKKFVLRGTMRIIFTVRLGVCACTEERLSPGTQWRKGCRRFPKYP